MTGDTATDSSLEDPTASTSTEKFSIKDPSGRNDFLWIINELMKDPDIAWFEPDFTVALPVANIRAQHTGQVVPWSVTAVGGEQSWAVSGNGNGNVENVEVYVLDTGVARGANNNYDDLVTGEHVDFRNLSSQNARDYDGHGTHIAGIIGAYDNRYGIAGMATPT